MIGYSQCLEPLAEGRMTVTFGGPLPPPVVDFTYVDLGEFPNLRALAAPAAELTWPPHTDSTTGAEAPQTTTAGPAPAAGAA